MITGLGCEEDGRSDAALMLAAYTRWGVRGVQRAVGDYAFVAWDPGAEVLFAARDRIGFRPLFYALDGSRLMVCSDLLALASAAGRWEIDEDYVGEYLSTAFNGPLNPGLTPFRGIHRVPPGHYLLVRRESHRVERYWDPSALEPLPRRRDQEYADELRELLCTVMRSHLRGVGRAGIALSGGIDSSALASIGARVVEEGHRSDDLEAITMTWDSADFDEAHMAVSVAASTHRIAHELVRCDQINPFGDLGLRQDEPWLQFHGMWQRAAEWAAGRGQRVFLDGLGGDELFQGDLAYMGDLARRGRFVELAAAATSVSRARMMPYRTIALNWILPSLLPPAATEWLRTKHSHGVERGFAWRLTDPPPWISPRLTASSRWPGGTKRPQLRAERVEYEWLILGARDNSRVWTAKYIFLPQRVDQRRPFLDARIVEFALRLPTRMKIRGPVQKIVLRQALHGILPPQVEHRHWKTGYDFLFYDGLRKSYRRLDRLFAKSRAGELGFIDPSMFRRELAAHVRGAPNPRPRDIFATIALEVWLGRL